MIDRQQQLIAQIKESSSRCHTPRQFNKLLEELQRFFGRDHNQLLPIACGWGYPNIKSVNKDGTVDFHCEIVSIRSLDFPIPYLNWYRTSGMVSRDPVILEWFKTGRPQVVSEVVKAKPDAFPEEFISKLKDFGLYHSLEGGSIFNSKNIQSFDIAKLPHAKEFSIAFFSIALKSELECNKYIGMFGEILPSICLALKNSYHKPTLTPRKMTILKYIALGSNHKEIAHALEISESAVKDHRIRILETLNAQNDANAVLIALVERVIKPCLYL
ncbi:MAG TPA: LuxR C-terminal-related transcriptional regulator [Nitrospiria bacterium]|nr:LuxR C-terminal-related transcriptional regulator [Nitrospiria bacterium]